MYNQLNIIDALASLKNRCTHANIYVGLDACYCSECGGEFPPRSEIYKRAISSAPELAPEQKIVLEQPLTTSAPEQKHWVETYSPSNKRLSYYRYIWMEGRKLHHVHIPGGNTTSVSAIAHLEAVREAIALGNSPQEIEKLINSQKSDRINKT